MAWVLLRASRRPSLLQHCLQRIVQRKGEIARLKTTQPAFPRKSLSSPVPHAKSTIRRGPPERILVYHGGTGKTIFLGMLRITAIFVFGASCLVVAPAFGASEFPVYIAPAVIIGGALPLLFISYTAAPFVNYIHLALPVFTRRSREQALHYARNLPPNATLFINTMKFTTIPRQTEVRLSDLVPDKAYLRPVTFRNRNPTPLPWWQGRAVRQFYTAEKSKPATATSTFYPDLWEHVYKRILDNSQHKKI
ncbi:hypothetical protein V8E54_011998 [Elaphomyces granulatus]